MGQATDCIHSNEHYQQLVNSHRIVFLLFTLETCPACPAAAELFVSIARKYARFVKSMVLDVAQTPRLEVVTGTPCLVIHCDGKIVEILKGFGPWETQRQTLKNTFSRYARRQAAAGPASPAAPPQRPPSSASPHAPGYRPPPANGPAGSSPGRPVSDSPQWR